MAKVYVAEAVGRVVDRAVQICGALGVSDDLPLAPLYREVRPFRIYDGPTEVHRWSIARRRLRADAAARAPRDRDADRGRLLRSPPALERFLDAHGLGSGPLRDEPDRRRPLQPHLPGRARGRARRPAAPAPPAAAALGARRAARGARAARARRARRRASRACWRVCDDAARPRRALLRDGARRRRRDPRRAAGGARRRAGAARSASRSSTRWPRCTPSTRSPPGWRASAGRPATSSGSCAASAASGEVNATRELPESTESPPGCRRTCPSRGAATVVHGDYRLGNLLFGPTRPPASRPSRLGARDDRRPAGRPRLPDRHLERGRRAGTASPLELSPATAGAGVPHARRAGRALRRGDGARRRGRCAGTRRSRSGRRPSSARRSTAATCAANRPVHGSPGSSAACRGCWPTRPRVPPVEVAARG